MPIFAWSSALEVAGEQVASAKCAKAEGQMGGSKVEMEAHRLKSDKAAGSLASVQTGVRGASIAVQPC